MRGVPGSIPARSKELYVSGSSHAVTTLLFKGLVEHNRIPVSVHVCGEEGNCEFPDSVMAAVRNAFTTGPRTHCVYG